jgi:hypothetical protein
MAIWDLMKVAERVFNTRETPEEREDRIRKENQELQERIWREDREHQSKENKKQKEMAKILLAGVQGLAGPGSGWTGSPHPQRDQPRLGQGQCAYFVRNMDTGRENVPSSRVARGQIAGPTMTPGSR